jgi:hypothetical protein
MQKDQLSALARIQKLADTVDRISSRIDQQECDNWTAQRKRANADILKDPNNASAQDSLRDAQRAMAQIKDCGLIL